MTIDVSGLRTKLAGAVYTPGDEKYEHALKHWASNVDRPAAVVAQVTSANDVSAALQFANVHGLDVAVSGGRHACWPASSTKGGLLIDMRRLNRVRVDPERKTVFAEGGATCGDIYTALKPYPLAWPGPSISAVGVAGLTLGGGFGYLSARYGMTIDSLLGAKLVLASGEILPVNEVENPDLFWAIRGGGSNFGIVTELVFKLIPFDHQVWHGMLIYKPDQVQDLAKTYEKYLKSQNDPKAVAAIIMGCLPPTFDPVLTLIAYYEGSEEDGKRIFQPFFDIKPVVNRTSTKTFYELNTALDAMVDTPGRRYMNWTAFKELTPAIVQECADSFIDLNKEHGSVTKGTLIILSDMALQKGGIIPPDATAFNRVPWLNCQILGDWAPDRVDLDGFMENWVDGLGDRIAKIELNNPDIPAEEKRAGKYAYWNASNGKTPASVVFGGNYERLRKLKKKYDPHSVFNKWYPIEPAE